MWPAAHQPAPPVVASIAEKTRADPQHTRWRPRRAQRVRHSCGTDGSYVDAGGEVDRGARKAIKAAPDSAWVVALAASCPTQNTPRRRPKRTATRRANKADPGVCITMSDEEFRAHANRSSWLRQGSTTRGCAAVVQRREVKLVEQWAGEGGHAWWSPRPCQHDANDTVSLAATMELATTTSSSTRSEATMQTAPMNGVLTDCSMSWTFRCASASATRSGHKRVLCEVEPGLGRLYGGCLSIIREQVKILVLVL